MAVAIRMKMIGRKHQPFFRVVVIDRQKAREGRNIEEVGTYDPLLKDKSKRAILNLERIDYWISVGAQPSDRVATLIKKMKTNKFGVAAAPPPMLAPKAPPPPAEGEGAATPAEGAEATTEGAEASS